LGSHLRDEGEAIHVISALEVPDAGLDCLNDASPFRRIEVVVHHHDFDLGPLGQVGGRVENELGILYVRFQRMHRYCTTILRPP
jgi:hypothetical protein